MTLLRGDKATVAPPDPNPKPPAITLPPLSCDAHFHVFGPRRVFRFADDSPYTPQDAPKEDLFRLHKLLGFERGVFVQWTTHGKDHSVVIDLIAAAPGRYRGVGLIDPSTPRWRACMRPASAVPVSISCHISATQCRPYGQPTRARRSAADCIAPRTDPARTYGVSLATNSRLT
jgi:Amidohydrolase